MCLVYFSPHSDVVTVFTPTGVFPHVVFPSVRFLQLPGGGGDAAFSWGEGCNSATLQRLQQGSFPLSRWTNHNHLQLLTGFGFTELST